MIWAPPKRRKLEVGLHVVDLEFVRHELVPWVLGQAGPEFPRLDDIGWAMHVRWLANNWGTAMFGEYEAEAKRRLGASSPLVRLKDKFGLHIDIPDDMDLSNRFGRFVPSEHMEGRPFLVAGPTPRNVTEQIERYHAIEQEVDLNELVQHQMHVLLEGHPAPVNASNYPVLTDPAGFDQDYARRAVEEYLAPMREALLNRPPPDPERPFRRDERYQRILLSLIETAGHLGATWMHRGVGFSILLEHPDIQFLELDDGFCFIEGLFDALPWLKWDIEQVLAKKGLGAVVERAHVPALRQCINRHRSALSEIAPAADLAKLDECLAFAEHRGWDVVETGGLVRPEEGWLP